MQIKNICKKIKHKIITMSSTLYIKYLKSLGMQIGEYTTFIDPSTNLIDENRAKWIKIGKSVVICKGVSILAHDYSWCVLKRSHKVLAPTGGGTVIIGDNVFLGQNCSILRNVEIGDNTIIGASTVITRNVPSNSVCYGSPLKIEPLDMFCKKRQEGLIEEVKRNLIGYKELNGVYPTEDEMGNFKVLFKERIQMDLNDYYSFDGSIDELKELYNATACMFSSYEKMLKELTGAE